MVLNIFAVLFVIVLTCFHSIFGLFSGLINVLCSILSLCVALGFFEALGHWISKDFALHTAYVYPITLLLLFVGTLIATRALADNLIRGNVRVPMYVDWVGGGICGFVNAQIAVGILIVGFLMLPFGDRVMMFQRYERTEEKANNRFVYERNSVWFSPDGFAVGLFNLLSSGSARGGTVLASVYPNFTDWVAWTGNTVQHESLPAPLRDQKGGDGFQSLKINSWWEQPGGLEASYRSNIPTRMSPDAKYDALTLAPTGGMRLIGMQLALAHNGADRGAGTALPSHRFRPTMFRVVGDTDAGPAQFFPIAIGGADANIEGGLRAVDPDSNFSVEVDFEKPDTPIDLYFETPTDFRPRFLEYRRFARTPVTEEQLVKQPAGRDLKLMTPERKREFEQLKQMGFIGITISPSGDTDALPFPMNPSILRNSEATVSGELFVSGHVAGPKSQFEYQQGQPQRMDKIRIPEGQRILQVRFRPRQAFTLAGQVFNFVGSTINQYYAVDNAGKRYRLAGYYGMVKRGGQDFFEMYLAPEADDPTNRGMLDFKQIRGPELRDGFDSEIGLFFYVPPGTTIVRVVNQTGGGVDVAFTTGLGGG